MFGHVTYGKFVRGLDLLSCWFFLAGGIKTKTNPSDWLLNCYVEAKNKNQYPKFDKKFPQFAS